MNTGKCPACGKPVQKARLEIIEPDLQTTKLYGSMPRGMAFICPNLACNTMLPVTILPDEPKGKR